MNRAFDVPTGLPVAVYSDTTALASAAAEHFVAAATSAIAERGRFWVGLAGGSTPRALYSLVAEEPCTGRIDWARVEVFFGDERCVPPDHADSNYRMARETLLSRVSIQETSVHRMPAELADANDAATRYEAELRQSFGLGPGELPRFDLILLGMGPDGHTASLFPRTAALDETERLVVANRVDQLGAWRLTLTPRVLNDARQVIFLVAGADKAETLRAVLRGPRDPARLPSQLVQPTSGRLLWLVDRAAAMLL